MDQGSAEDDALMGHEVGDVLTANDLEPGPGARVRDAFGRVWECDEHRPACWSREGDDPESWTKVAGNYGPVTLLSSEPVASEPETADAPVVFVLWTSHDGRARTLGVYASRDEARRHRNAWQRDHPDLYGLHVHEHVLGAPPR